MDRRLDEVLRESETPAVQTASDILAQFVTAVKNPKYREGEDEDLLDFFGDRSFTLHTRCIFVKTRPLAYGLMRSLAMTYSANNPDQQFFCDLRFPTGLQNLHTMTESDARLTPYEIGRCMRDHPQAGAVFACLNDIDPEPDTESSITGILRDLHGLARSWNVPIFLTVEGDIDRSEYADPCYIMPTIEYTAERDGDLWKMHREATERLTTPKDDMTFRTTEYGLLMPV